MRFANPVSFCCPGDRRRGSIEQARRFLTEQKLDDENEVVVYPDSLGFHEVRQVVGAAFGGKTSQQANSFMMYVLRALNLQDVESTQERQEVSAFCLGFFPTRRSRKMDSHSVFATRRPDES